MKRLTAKWDDALFLFVVLTSPGWFPVLFWHAYQAGEKMGWLP
jgi:hypothetical protein